MEYSNTTNNISENIQPYINQTVPVYLYTSSWVTVVQDNNVLNASIKITNLAGNSWIMVRVLNSSGQIIAAPSSGIKPGQTSAPIYIPYNAGKYTVQAKSGVNGNYTINVTDQKQ